MSTAMRFALLVLVTALSACDDKPKRAEANAPTITRDEPDAGAAETEASTHSKPRLTDDALATLAEPAERLMRRIRNSPICTEEQSLEALSAERRRRLLGELDWTADLDTGYVVAGVYCMPAEPCEQEVELVDPRDELLEYLRLLAWLCEDEWRCGDWECTTDVTLGMEAVVRFAPSEDGAVIAGTFQTPMTDYDDGTIEAADVKKRWKQEISKHFLAAPDR